AVTVSANQPVAVVVNTQADKASVANPVASATDGITSGAATVYGAYAAKNAQGVGRRSSIIVQNLGGAAATPKITFTPLTGGRDPRDEVLPSEPHEVTLLLPDADADHRVEHAHPSAERHRDHCHDQLVQLRRWLARVHADRQSRAGHCHAHRPLVILAAHR